MKVLKSIGVVLLVLMVLSMFVGLIVSTTGVAEPKRELEVYNSIGYNGTFENVVKVENGGSISDENSNIVINGNYMKKGKEYSFIFDFSSSQQFKDVLSATDFSCNTIFTGMLYDIYFGKNIVINGMPRAEKCFSSVQLPDGKVKIVINSEILNYSKFTYPDNVFEIEFDFKGTVNGSIQNRSERLNVQIFNNDIQLKK